MASDLEEGAVLSDVHIDVHPSNQKSHGEFTLTVFNFTVPQSDNNSSDSEDDSDSEEIREPEAKCLRTAEETVCVDEDGDLVLQRRKTNCTEMEVHIQHAMATPLDTVGLQVWRGALLMCDFILHNQDVFKSHSILELGGGVGLVSIVAGAVGASKVYCTDIGDRLLELCRENVSRNEHLFQPLSASDKKVVVKRLDWLEEEFQKVDETEKSCVKSLSEWTKADLEDLEKNVDIILAADVAYDNELTDGFFKSVFNLITCGQPKTLYVALERRYNFTLEDLDVTCKSYDHFRKCLCDLEGVYECIEESADSESSSQAKIQSSEWSKITESQKEEIGRKEHRAEPIRFLEVKSEQVSTDFPQYSDYTRVKELELWKVSSKFLSLDS
ncbi:PREDICTED: methyltransferase-like protein 22 [Branchiostoma belcheri]|uniref:Methyltransferase-like protein 22 n=1 Tax=Branchiostoma belcheri TaxID=7741 RepID=A0A6P4YUF4_BRABE|nr:PREDICTED: methyltransferase-like protein 22 [Branchiostoma belcheri]